MIIYGEKGREDKMNISEYVQNFIGIIQTISCLLIGFSLLGVCISIASRYPMLYMSIMGILVGACGLCSEVINSLPYNLDFVILLILMILCAISVDLDRKTVKKDTSVDN
uniref:hypothetical protein n=1 Tax=Bacillus subtilis TaxID=1423 RepID=UPI00155DCC63|nr:hypothetical protein [Bacillus subtilis]